MTNLYILRTKRKYDGWEGDYLVYYIKGWIEGTNIEVEYQWGHKDQGHAGCTLIAYRDKQEFLRMDGKEPVELWGSKPDKSWNHPCDRPGYYLWKFAEKVMEQPVLPHIYKMDMSDEDLSYIGLIEEANLTVTLLSEPEIDESQWSMVAVKEGKEVARLTGYDIEGKYGSIIGESPYDRPNQYMETMASEILEEDVTCYDKFFELL